MKFRLLLVSLLLTLVPGGALFSQNSEPADGREQPVVSVLLFENLTEEGEHEWMARSLADGLTAFLGEGPLVLVDRIDLESVLKEQKLALAGITDDATALEVGKLLNTTQLIRGGFLVRDGALRITATVTDTTTGEILFSTSAGEAGNRYFAAERSLAEALAGFYGLSLPADPRRETDSLTALSRYYQGLVLLDGEAYAEAAEAFRSSLAEDPAFQNPRESLEDCYRFLKDFRKARYQRELNTLYARLGNLIGRSEQTPFVSYGDWVMQSMAEGMTAQEISDYTQKHPEMTWGNTRAEVLWHAQTVMMEIAGNGVEYFDDHEEAGRMYDGVIAVSLRAKTEMAEDPFLPELIYQELLAWRYRENWENVMTICESLMFGWPDYRMMWAVEGFYERALEELESLPES